MIQPGGISWRKPICIWQDQSNAEVYIGVTASGICIYKNRVRITHFPWWVRLQFNTPLANNASPLYVGAYRLMVASVCIFQCIVLLLCFIKSVNWFAISLIQKWIKWNRVCGLYGSNCVLFPLPFLFLRVKIVKISFKSRQFFVQLRKDSVSRFPTRNGYLSHIFCNVVCAGCSLQIPHILFIIARCITADSQLYSATANWATWSMEKVQAKAFNHDVNILHHRRSHVDKKSFSISAPTIIHIPVFDYSSNTVWNGMYQSLHFFFSISSE